MFDALADAVFAVSPAIRYVAWGRGQDVQLTQRADLASASSSESDRQRGEIDCGGLDYLVVAYGSRDDPPARPQSGSIGIVKP